MVELEYTVLGKAKTIPADRIEGEFAYIKLLGTAGFTTAKRTSFVNFRQSQDRLRLFFEVDSSTAEERITKNSDQTIKQSLSSQGFDFTVGSFDDPEEGITAIHNAVLRYGERIVSTEIFQHYVEMIRRCYDPKHPCYPKEGAIGIRVCKEWLEDFARFAEDMSMAPSVPHLTIDSQITANQSVISHETR